MKVAVIGSRCLTIDNLEKYLPEETTTIISGGVRGIDSCARMYAINNNIELIEFLPDYLKYGRTAPLKRNMDIINSADLVLAFWDGKSRGTKFVINNCIRSGVPLKVYRAIK